VPCSPPQTPRRRGKKKRQIKGKKKSGIRFQEKEKGTKVAKSAPQKIAIKLSLSQQSRRPAPLPASAAALHIQCETRPPATGAFKARE